MPHRNREPRKSVQIGVRLKDDSGWTDARILNLSSRGVMALCENPPRRGSYVEIRRGGYVLIGRVAWSGADRIGVHVRERIELDDLLRPPSGPRRHRREADCQLREAPRRKPSAEEREAASARFCRAFEFAAITIFAVGLTFVASTLAQSALSEPLEQVEKAMRGRDAPG